MTIDELIIQLGILTDGFRDLQSKSIFYKGELQDPFSTGDYVTYLKESLRKKLDYLTGSAAQLRDAVETLVYKDN